MPKETPGVLFPLEITANNSGYELADVKESVRFNLKNIILTNPGERIMIPDFGVGIKAALFEFASFELLDKIKQRITNQIRRYAPYITITQLLVNTIDEQSINIKMSYIIDFIQITDFIEIDVSNI
jgi:phage baseplate assembly protein W|tara:strand:+ start:5787 stop:6164 length:378 start_codon:yes stop_codon:yes gene_type:complete